jgi:hypothetical protein
MNKLQLIQALQESQDLSKTEAAKCVELFFSAMANTLSIGDRVEIRGLCSFLCEGIWILHRAQYEDWWGCSGKNEEFAGFQDGNGIEAAG